MVSAGVFKTSPFSVIDVGASSGIEARWLEFSPCLRATGFEPAIQEVERLNTHNKHHGVEYVAAYAGCEKLDKLFPSAERNDPVASRSNASYARFSSYRARSITGYKQIQQQGDVRLTDRRIELDDYFKDRITEINFVKIDTDGHDYEVLLGAEKLAQSPNLLGFYVECQFNGPAHPHSNIFSNIDSLLRKNGYDIFDMNFFRYSRSALPQPFLLSIPAQTTLGQPVWGDVLFMRDFGSPLYEKTWGMETDEIHIMKLACVYELFGLHDCAAELLVKYRSRLNAIFDVEACLNLLVPSLNGQQISFEKYNSLFDSNIELFFSKKR
jgi:FkbM family methyltransferase